MSKERKKNYLSKKNIYTLQTKQEVSKKFVVFFKATLHRLTDG